MTIIIKTHHDGVLPADKLNKGKYTGLTWLSDERALIGLLGDPICDPANGHVEIWDIEILDPRSGRVDPIMLYRHAHGDTRYKAACNGFLPLTRLLDWIAANRFDLRKKTA